MLLISGKNPRQINLYEYFINYTFVTGLQIHLYLEQPMEIQLFATFFQRRNDTRKV
jgi:hypothetical protein